MYFLQAHFFRDEDDLGAFDFLCFFEDDILDVGEDDSEDEVGVEEVEEVEEVEVEEVEELDEEEEFSSEVEFQQQLHQITRLITKL